MKRLLCLATSMNTGGAETFMMKLYHSIDKSKYQMDFCLTDNNPGYYDNEIKFMGGRIFYTVKKTDNLYKCLKGIKNIVKTKKYDYVLRVSAQSLSVLDLMAAKAGGAKRLVFRSTNAGVENKKEMLLNKMFFFLPRLVPDVKIAPSTEAAEFMFGKNCVTNGKAIILNNAVNIDIYSFNPKSRIKLRNEINAGDGLLIGHIGRFSKQKNHIFLIEIFKEILKRDSSAHLVLVGTGELKDEIAAKAIELECIDRIVFLGVRNDIPDILSAIDIIVFPSLYEGLPNTIIEAQATGLRCILSDVISHEVDLTGDIKFLSLNSPASEWADMTVSYGYNYERHNNKEVFINKGYDIETVTRRFEQIVFE